MFYCMEAVKIPHCWPETAAEWVHYPSSYDADSFTSSSMVKCSFPSLLLCHSSPLILLPAPSVRWPKRDVCPAAGKWLWLLKEAVIIGYWLIAMKPPGKCSVNKYLSMKSGHHSRNTSSKRKWVDLEASGKLQCKKTNQSQLTSSPNDLLNQSRRTCVFVCAGSSTCPAAGVMMWWEDREKQELPAVQTDMQSLHCCSDFARHTHTHTPFPIYLIWFFFFLTRWLMNGWRFCDHILLNRTI